MTQSEAYLPTVLHSMGLSRKLSHCPVYERYCPAILHMCSMMQVDVCIDAYSVCVLLMSCKYEQVSKSAVHSVG